MTGDLVGRTAIVTGSSRRNGRAIVRALAASGASVVVNARTSREEVETVVREIESAGGLAVSCLADVTNRADVDRLISSAVDNFGGLDILVNNAAVRVNDDFRKMTFIEWRTALSVILDGAFLCCQAAAPYLTKSGRGRIVNITGIAGYRGTMRRAHVVTAKAGLHGLSKALALELAPDITVNCVSPGKIEDEGDGGVERMRRDARMSNELIPLNRSGSTSDVADAVQFLCSDRAGYITGQTLHVNGGAYW